MTGHVVGVQNSVIAPYKMLIWLKKSTAIIHATDTNVKRFSGWPHTHTQKRKKALPTRKSGWI
eukprot:m.31829 g.31829  ORF g.31829 m.31829 type:complete len:63 (+) comp9465_c0_seq2:587-775(+)